MAWSFNIGGLNVGWGSGVRYSREGNNHTYTLTDPNLGKFLSCLNGGYSEQNMLTLFCTIPEVFAPINEIAKRVAAANFQLKRKEDDEVVDNNEVWNKLRAAPNWKQTFDKLVYNATVYKYTCGNRYFYTYAPDLLKLKPQNISALWLLPPQFTNIKLKQTRPKFFNTTKPSDLIEAYEVKIGETTEQIKPEYAIHDAYIDTSYGHNNERLKGHSPLVACEYPMSNLIAVYQARNVIYVKRGALGAIVSKKGDASGLISLTKPERKQLEEDFQGSYGLDGSRETVAITNQPVEYIRFGMSISELEPFDETRASAEAVYGALGVPAEMMPGKDNTYENYKTAERGLYQNVAIPDAKEIARILTQLYHFDEDGLYICPDFSHIESLQENKKEKADVDFRNNETNRVRFLHGVITLNDWVIESGYDKVTNALYDKRVFEMTPEELETVKSVIGNKPPEKEEDKTENDNGNNKT